MHRIVANMKWIMLVTGLLTCSMIYVAIAPQAGMQGTFGTTIDGPVGEILVRNWGVLVALTGGMLIYGAFNIVVRPLVLTIAGISKLTFSVLVLTSGQAFLGSQAVTAATVDLVEAVLFAAYLVATARKPVTTPV